MFKIFIKEFQKLQKYYHITLKVLTWNGVIILHNISEILKKVKHPSAESTSDHASISNIDRDIAIETQFAQ